MLVNTASTFFRNSKVSRILWNPNHVARCLQTATSNQSTSVNPQEIAHFDKLAQDWWLPNGPMKPLFALNELRVPFIRDGLLAISAVPTDRRETTKCLDGFNLLEVGCGAGILTENLARLNANVVGIDPSSEVIEAAKHHVSTESPELTARMQYKNETIENFAKDNLERFDAVIMSEVVEHVDDVPKFVAAGVDTLKPGGSIFITTINRTIPALLLSIFAAEYIFRFVPQGTHQWNKFITPLETQRILESLNCTPVIVNGYTYECWRNTWKWTSDTNLCYAIQAVKRSDSNSDEQKI